MEELIKHYVDLLIIQYKTKSKAAATIGAFVRTLFSDRNDNILLNEIQNAYDLDTAQEAQLNIIAKYIGYDKYIDVIDMNYFKLSDMEGVEVSPGLSDMETDDIFGYPILSYSGYTYKQLSVVGFAGIEEFRKVLNFLSEMKNKILSLGYLDYFLDKNFNGSIYVEEENKKIIYHIKEDYLKFLDSENKLKAFFEKFFPRPMGNIIEIVRDPYY